MKKIELVQYIKNKISKRFDGSVLIIAVDGIGASGKTTIARLLHKEIKNSYLLSIDMFHNKREIRKAKGRLSPVGYYEDSFNYDYVINNVLRPIKNNVSVFSFKEFNHFEDDYIDQIEVNLDETPIIIFEGVFMHRTELLEYIDYSVFLDVSFEEMLKRASVRDLKHFNNLEDLINTYNKRYMGGQKIYLTKEVPTLIANIVINNEDYSNPIIISEKERTT